ncbi:MAG: hypothetical protein ACI9MB_004589, partial [Verrucomicrobiales bacterium]
GIGIDDFEFWLPKRRPEGRNLAITVDPPVSMFRPENVLTGPSRPVEAPNAWVAASDDPQPELILSWERPVTMNRLIIELDADWDHPMESVLMTHPEEVVPFLIRDFDIIDSEKRTVCKVRNHRSGRYELHLEKPLTTNRLVLRILGTWGMPAAVFRIRCIG